MTNLLYDLDIFAEIKRYFLEFLKNLAKYKIAIKLLINPKLIKYSLT